MVTDFEWQPIQCCCLFRWYSVEKQALGNVEINDQYPPSMNITKLANGTVIYNGLAFDMFDYVAKGLNIR